MIFNNNKKSKKTIRRKTQTKIIEFIFTILDIQEIQLSLINSLVIFKQRTCCSCNNKIDSTDFVIVGIVLRLSRSKIVNQNVEIEHYFGNCIKKHVTQSQEKHAKNKIGASNKIINYFFK